MTALERISKQAIRDDGRALLRTERLILRAPRLDDAPVLAELLNDIRIAQNTARIPHPYTLADAEAFIAYVQGGGECAFLVTLADDTVIGGCGVGRLRGDAPEIGYWFGVPFWNRGYATEAARAVIDYAFSELGENLLHAGARVSNPASRRVLEKCGYEWTGVVLQRVRALGTSVPCDRFRLTRERWSSLIPADPPRRPASAAPQLGRAQFDVFPGGV
jgi:RimJ/RimL family protein N-acetyltransferase